METLRERVVKYHEETGAKYKDIAQACDIGFSTMYNFTSGLRELKPFPAGKLDKYLKEKGY